jgi:hypothetical protein
MFPEASADSSADPALAHFFINSRKHYLQQPSPVEG